MSLSPQTYHPHPLPLLSTNPLPTTPLDNWSLAYCSCFLWQKGSDICVFSHNEQHTTDSLLCTTALPRPRLDKMSWRSLHISSLEISLIPFWSCQSPMWMHHSGLKHSPIYKQLCCLQYFAISTILQITLCTWPVNNTGLNLSIITVSPPHMRFLCIHGFKPQTMWYCSIYYGKLSVYKWVLEFKTVLFKGQLYMYLYTVGDVSLDTSRHWRAGAVSTCICIWELQPT